MGNSLGLAAYLAVSTRLTGFAEKKLAQRLAEGKEHPERLSERRGQASVARPSGTLIWFHAASVGESLSLVTLIENLLDAFPDLNVLVTTGTRSSADLMATRLPEGTIHQFVPLDALPFVKSFLNHWHPDIAVWTESELWPALIAETDSRRIPMVLLNARMSRRSYQRWRLLPGIVKSLLRRFQRIFAQDEQSAQHLRKLGAPNWRLEVIGSLKEGSEPLPHDEAERVRLTTMLDTRPVWLAASTHPGEEELVAEAHRQACKAYHRMLLIIAPRHPERGPEIAEALRADGWAVALRSAGEEPTTATKIYVADTLGEMGLWYRMAPVSFLGGSLVNIGGHNPYEPAALGSAILYGPHVSSAQEVYARLEEVGGAKLVSDVDELAEQVIRLTEPQHAAAMAHAAWEISSSGAGATDRAVEYLSELIEAAEAKA